MKRLTLLALVVCLISSLNAQDSMRFEKYYPHTGDWGISFSASPFINFVGNLIRVGSDHNFYNPLKLSFSPTLIHMVSNNKARIYSLNYYGTHETHFYDAKVYIEDPLETHTFEYYTVKDKLTVDFYRIKAGIGTQWRKGKGRFQLYYGYLFNLTYVFGPKAKFTPGYDFSSIDTVETVYSMSINIVPESDYSNFDIDPDFIGYKVRSGQRNLSISYGGGVGLGATAIMGVDFFVLPKIAVGGNVSFYGAGHYFFPGQRTFEYFNFNNPNNIIYEIRTEQIPAYFSLNFHYNLVSGLYIRIFL